METVGELYAKLDLSLKDKAAFLGLLLFRLVLSGVTLPIFDSCKEVDMSVRLIQLFCVLFWSIFAIFPTKLFGCWPCRSQPRYGSLHQSFKSSGGPDRPRWFYPELILSFSPVLGLSLSMIVCKPLFQVLSKPAHLCILGNQFADSGYSETALWVFFASCLLGVIQIVAKTIENR